MGFSAWEFDVFSKTFKKLFVVIVPVSFGLIKHTGEESRVPRRQDGTATGQGLVGMLSGTTLHAPAFSGLVPRKWAQHSLFWFQISQLPPLACTLQHKGKKKTLRRETEPVCFCC